VNLTAVESRYHPELKSEYSTVPTVSLQTHLRPIRLL